MTQRTRKSKPRKTTQAKSKAIYRVKNWRDYDKSLVQRGSLTFWMDEVALKQWVYQGPAHQGAQFDYSDSAIQTVLTMREVFRLTNRATEGFMQSLFQLLNVDLKVPEHSTLSRRGKTFKATLPKRASGELHLVLDSSGLKVYGEGEWKVRQHGWSKRRTWRKLHLTIEADSGEIQAAILTEAMSMILKLCPRCSSRWSSRLRVSRQTRTATPWGGVGVMTDGMFMKRWRFKRHKLRLTSRPAAMPKFGNTAIANNRRWRGTKICVRSAKRAVSNGKKRVGIIVGHSSRRPCFDSKPFSVTI